MKRIFLLAVVLTAALLVGFTQAANVSSVPNLVNFQGKLTDALGNPLGGSPHTFIFRLYTLPAAGGLL